ncbi:phage minor capsid protein [Streptosporangium lutulentum]|uniref:ADP ribosyltransferase domain-containing protein n=1 Tax=Streptosporangium lutulentum TaxID=1461250 RepID=A0ABT9Q9C6_9ACTN|nr:phage minor capsid protein [Streptosporangium lutulentum]MDP9843262.1 hypothetical protein [Streptosporangium lutulentum]
MAEAIAAVEERIELAMAISATYADAEEHLFEVIGKAVAKGTSPQYAADRLAAIKELSAQAEKVLKDLETLASELLKKGVTQAWEDGLQRAAEELDQLGSEGALTPGQGLVQLLKESLGLLPPLTTGALRMVNDIYRQVIAETTPLALTGAVTRLQATTAALQKFAAKGISGFVDSKNRTWSISAYAEMAARTAMARAANEGHLSTLRENGRDLVIVSRAPYRCPVCKPWEGKILSQAGTAGDRKETNVLTGNPVTVKVAGTVADAREAGLQHPNCKHTFSVYLPGLTKPPPKLMTTGTYEDSQEQRRLERQIRGWKRRAAAAPEGSSEKKAANQHVKAYQAQMREHLDKTGLLRQSARERVRPDETTSPDLHPSLVPPKPKPKPAPPTPTPTPTPAPASTPALTGVEAGDFSKLRQVGGQGGSNPGGLFEDENGNRYYVKTQKSEQHAANEIASTRLYAAAGIRVPEIHRGRGAPGLPDGVQTASRIIDGVQTTPEKLRGPAREGFAVDAWLANWDTAGLTFDNMLLTDSGDVARIDTGGSMLFRAQGDPKGDAFGDTVPEWTTMRDKGTAPQASRLFSDMTPAEELAALKRVEQVTPDAIRSIVADSGLPESIADKLIARRADLLQRLPASDRRTSSMRDAARHRTNSEGMRWLQDKMPAIPSDQWVREERRAIWDYTGNSFTSMNNALRRGGGSSATMKRIDDLDKAMTRQKVPESVIVHRGVDSGYTQANGVDINSPDEMYGLIGRVMRDKAYMSTSVGQRAAFTYQPIRLMLRVPGGHEAINVDGLSANPGERELLLRRDTTYIVHSVYKVGSKWFIEAEVVPDDWFDDAPLDDWQPDAFGDAHTGY